MRLLSSLLLATAILFLAAPRAAEAGASCTDGTDCLCDRLAGNSNVVFCEDWEARTLYENVGLGNGAPDYGPWYDHTGDSNRRGFNSYWTRHYGLAIGSCLWGSGEPSPPLVGASCKNSSGCRVAEYCSADQGASMGLGRDCWGDGAGSTNRFACVDIQRASDLDDEISSLAGPKPFDGLQQLAYRISPGRTNGIVGAAQFRNGEETTLGLTMAVGYAANIEQSGILDYPWKHDEWDSKSHWTHGISSGCTGTPTDSRFPYCPFIDLGGRTTESAAACEASLEKDAGCQSIGNGRYQCARGTAYCDTRLRYQADTRYYDQSADFPHGTMHCSQAKISGLGTSNVRIQLWHDGVQIVDINGFDGSLLSHQSFSKIAWNAYSNANQTSDPTSQTTYRYQDNIVVTNGDPVSCSAIGFGTTGSDSGTSTDPGSTTDPLGAPGRPTLLD